jgi:hypothetical protein
MRTISSFLLLCAAYALPVFSQDTSTIPNTKPVPRMQVLPLPDYQASFQFDGKELTRFHFDPEAKRPFWYPIQTTMAPSLVRMGHPHDPHGHRHHYGVWMTHNSVDGVSFWSDEKDKGGKNEYGSIRVQNVLGYWDGDDSASMLTLNHWVSERDNRILLLEKRHTELKLLPDATSWLLIIDSEFLAPKGKTTTFDKNNFGLLGVRMAKQLDTADGGGRIMNSEGQINEEQIHEKPARWCDYSGRLTNDEKGFAGITLFNHPQNPYNPTDFHVRKDGWMCACFSRNGALTVNDTTPLRGRWALWVHEGVASKEKCEEMWQAFCKLPPADLAKKP